MSTLILSDMESEDVELGKDGKPRKLAFHRLLAFILIGLLIIPASIAWSVEFRYLYYQIFNADKNPDIVRLSYAFFLTILVILIIYIIWRYTDWFVME